jgi:tetratricopeptide (TPR) repeat protein
VRAGIALGLIALVLAVFFQVRHHEFVDLDDLAYIVYNESLRASSPAEALRTAFTTTSVVSWIPLTVLSLQVDRALYGTEPAGYLLTNVGLHALASVALFLALAGMTGATGCSAFVAAVFAVHPLHVESVAWASERKDVLSGLFWMLTLAAHAHHAARPMPGRYALVLAALLLGLLAKPMLVTLPCALLLLDYWPLRRLGRRAWLEKLPMLALSAAVGAATLFVQRATGSMRFGDAIPLGERLANAVDSYVVYVWKSLWPTGLAVFYPHPRSGLPPLRVAAAALALAAATGVALRLRRSRPWLLVGWLWYLGTLVPVIGLVQVGLQARADRYTYIPMVGLAIALAWGAADLCRGRAARRGLAAAGAAAVAALAAAAFVQVGTWRDSVTLFERDLAIAPESLIAHMQLATVHLRAGRYEQAEHHYRETYRLSPAEGHANLVRFQFVMGDLHERRGDPAAAALRYREALRLDPKSRRANAALGLALLAAGRPDEARAPLERARGEPPADARLLARLCYLAQSEGRHAEAVSLCREALRLDPRATAPRNNLAWLLATAPDAALRDPDEALRLAEGLVARSNEPPADALDTLAAAQAAAGRIDLAVRTAERALDAAARERADELAAAIRARLARYRAGAAWVEPAAAPSR